MTLTSEFLEKPVADLAAPEFQDRLRKELRWSHFAVIIGALAAMVSAGVLFAAIWAVIGHLQEDPDGRSPLGPIILAVEMSGKRP